MKYKECILDHHITKLPSIFSHYHHCIRLINPATMSFEDREDIVDGIKPTIQTKIVKAMSLMLADPTLDKILLNDNLVLSSAYWVVNKSDSKNVTYLATVLDGTPTSAGQQSVAFIGLAYLMGFVKEPTLENKLACTKRWSAGLAGVRRVNVLSEACINEIWNYIVTYKGRLYSSMGVKNDLLGRYLETRRTRDREPPLVVAVLTQLDLVYQAAYLKSVDLMSQFSVSGNRALEIPSVTREAMILDQVLTEVKRIEGAEYSLCRLLDNNKYPELNHSNYPNLYAATLEWARRTKKIQRNYQGSKSLIDQALHMDIVKKVLKMTSISSGTQHLTQEQKEWLKVKGYTIPELTLADILAKDTQRKRRRSARDSDSSSDSESESEKEEEPRRKRKPRRD